MPNVEVHGFTAKEAGLLERRIFNLFKDDEVSNDMVVSRCPTKVRNKLGEKQPFLRVIHTPTMNIFPVLAKLETLGIDIEQVEITKYIPAKK